MSSKTIQPEEDTMKELAELEESNADTVQLILTRQDSNGFINPYHSLDYPQVAMELAQIAHEGQVDKAGEPHINHVARVVEAVRKQVWRLEFVDRLEAEAAAWLHDVVEDAGVDLMQVAHAFPGGIAVTVDALTRREGEVYADYIIRVARSHTPAARIIKRADLYDNRFRGTLPASMERRYDHALDTLNQEGA